jgi:signal transduction histidine kinase
MSRRQSRLVLGAAAVVLLALLATFAIALANSQSKADNDVKQRFRERAQVSAALTRALFATIAEQSGPQNAKLYGGAQVSAAALTKQQTQSGGRGGFLAVLDNGGRLLATSAHSPSNLPQLLAATAPLQQAVLHGQVYALSDVIGAGTPAPTMQLLDPFATRYGPRVLVSGFAPPLIASFISGYLAQVPNASGGHAYALDAHGVIIASTDRRQAPGAMASEAGLLAAIAHLREGSFGSGRYFASVPVRGSTWHVVLTAPTAKLFASVNGARKWLPWGLFIAFALAAVVAIAMLRGVLGSTARVAVANKQLGHANEQLAVTNRALEQRARELARSNAELEQFASIASHDLQEPLRKVQTFAEQLRVREQDQLSENGLDYLGRMSSAARRMQDLIDDLLRFSRVTTNTRPFVAVDLTATAHEVAADLEGVIGDTGATVEVDELPTVQADPLQMRQLLQNLLSNALKFHGDGVAPHVKIGGRVAGRFAAIAVSDDGIGFDERYAQRIFRVFERLHGRGVYPGTGIGLALCRKIVERHGGTITATSAPGQGATFLVMLPLEHADDELEWIAEPDLPEREAGATAAEGIARDGEQPYVAV